MNKKNETIFLNKNKKQLIKMFSKITRKTNIEKWVENFISFDITHRLYINILQ